MKKNMITALLVVFLGNPLAVLAKPNAPHGNGVFNSHHNGNLIDNFIGKTDSPPGLKKQGKMPYGLAKKNKTPPGWSNKNRAENDSSSLANKALSKIIE